MQESSLLIFLESNVRVLDITSYFQFVLNSIAKVQDADIKESIQYSGFNFRTEHDNMNSIMCILFMQIWLNR